MAKIPPHAQRGFGRLAGRCVRCKWRKAHARWYAPEEPQLCWPCKNTEDRRKHREHMPTYGSFAEVDRSLCHGTYIRILGNPEPYFDGVYRIVKNNNSQGFVWGNRIFPGPFRLWGYQGSRPRELRPWPGDDMPPGYTIPGIGDDEDL